MIESLLLIDEKSLIFSNIFLFRFFLFYFILYFVYLGSPQQLSTGFTPLTSTYPNVNGYLGGGSQQQTYASAALLPVSNVSNGIIYDPSKFD